MDGEAARVAARESGDDRVQSNSEISRDVSRSTRSARSGQACRMAASPQSIGCNVTLPLDMTSGCLANKIDNGARMTANCEINRPAANRAVFNERLVRLRGVDLQRENFAAMRTGGVNFNKKFHVVAVLVLKHRTNKQALESKRLYNFQSAPPRFVVASAGLASSSLRKCNCFTLRASVWETVTR
jgi:hypothetical protein